MWKVYIWHVLLCYQYMRLCARTATCSCGDLEACLQETPDISVGSVGGNTWTRCGSLELNGLSCIQQSSPCNSWQRPLSCHRRSFRRSHSRWSLFKACRPPAAEHRGYHRSETDYLWCIEIIPPVKERYAMSRGESRTFCLRRNFPTQKSYVSYHQFLNIRN